MNPIPKLVLIVLHFFVFLAVAMVKLAVAMVKLFSIPAFILLHIVSIPLKGKKT